MIKQLVFPIYIRAKKLSCKLESIRRKIQLFFSHAYRFDYQNYHPRILEEWQDENGKCWDEILDDDNWIGMGYVRRPQTKIQWIFFDLVQGVLMRYPFHKVILYIISHHIVGYPK